MIKYLISLFCIKTRREYETDGTSSLFHFPRRFLFLLPALFVLTVSAGSKVSIVYGDQSLGNAGESQFAKSLSNHAARWMKDGGLTAEIYSDRQLDAALKDRKVTILVYCAQPTSSQVARIRKYVKDGGKVIVTFSSSEELASLMGVKLGKYVRNSENSFYSMTFEERRPPNIQAYIRQSSANIVQATPITGKSRVIAWWTAMSGAVSKEAAWLECANGYWMTHVLLADGDSSAKGKLLVALCANLSPGLWLDAASARLNAAGTTGSWKSIGAAFEDIRKRPASPRNKQVAKLLKQAEEARRNAEQMLAVKRGPEAWMLVNEYRMIMEQAYGFLQEPKSGEIKAVWEHSGQGLYPGDWDRTMAVLKKNGISDIFVNVAGPGFAHCNISSFPKSAVYDSRGDQLKAALAAGKKYGIRVHAWLICCSTTQATSSRMAIYAKDNLLLGKTGGGTANWLDPSSTDAKKKIVSAARELLSRYNVDGIHLDFIRYPDYYGSLGSATRIRFEKYRGKKIGKWPDDVKSGPLFKELVKWRANEITSIVADIRAVQRSVAPGKLVTAAVLGKYPACIESVGQDWIAWLDRGYIDYAVPMNYTENGALYTELIGLQTKQKKHSMRIIGGIGVTAAESRLSSDRVIDQITELRKHNTAGFALFDLDTSLEKEILPVLAAGITGK